MKTANIKYTMMAGRGWHNSRYILSEGLASELICQVVLTKLSADRLLANLTYESRHEKNCLRCFRPGPTLTVLYNHRR